jgi:putative redox protein
MATVVLERVKGNFGFEVKDELGHIINTDSSFENGGDDFGFRPMQLLLAALGSCSAIDMISILNKQKQHLTALKIEVKGEREKNVIPALWQKVLVIFHVFGNVDVDKAVRASALSMEKYCSVAETLRRAGTDITWKTKVNVQT